MSAPGRRSRHPFRGFTWFDLAVPTGSRTHPWLHSTIPSGFGRKKLTQARLDSRNIFSFEDSI